jgi:translation initiation factor IF-2
LGKLKVLAIFRTEKNNQIIGGKVLEGKVEINSRAEVFREKEYQTEGVISKLQSGKQDVNEVNENIECGMQFEGSPVIQVGDILHFYKEEKIIKRI